MRAARLKQTKTPLVIEQIEEPPLHPGGVILRVMAAPVISYTHEVFAGGVPAEIPLHYMTVMRQELTIRGSFMYPRFAYCSIIF
jgi:NADPH:quinone reductase-like Zn-dependent oxidoreductase